jgi:uncharacterized protein (TIGR03437 family)
MKVRSNIRRFLLACVAADLAHSALAQPVINAGGVVSAGLSVPAQAVLSPGAIFSIFGSGFAPAGTVAGLTSADIVNGALPTTLANVCVQVGGMKAPLFLVTPTQINAQVPSIATSGATVQVVTGCDSSTPVTSNGAFVLLAAASPEFFYFQASSTGDNPVAANDATTGGSYVGPGGAALPFATVAANPGDIVVVYATGFGPTSPPTPAGTLAAGNAAVASPFTVYLGGRPVPPANILYAGVAPSYAGLYQLNFRVPQSTPAGAQNLTISIAGVTSPPGANLYVASGGCTLPVIETFNAFPQQLAAQGSTKISWFVDGATSISTQPSLGSTAATSQVTQTLSSTATFQLTATNSCGTSTASLTVGVGTPSVSGIQDSSGQPVSSVFAGDTIRLAFSNLGDPTTIQDIIFLAPDGLPYAYPPDSVDAQGNLYITAPVLPEMSFTAPTSIQLSATTAAGQISGSQTLNISLPSYSGNAVQDFTAYLSGLAGGYQSALNDLGSVSGATMASTLSSGVAAFLAPLQSVMAQLATGSSAQLQVLPATSSNPNPGTITITAQDVGLFLALLGRASIGSPGVSLTSLSRSARARGAGFGSMGVMSTKSEIAHAASCGSIQEQVPLIPKCQRVQQVNHYLGDFTKLLGSLGNLATIAGAVAELYPAVEGLSLTLGGGAASVIALAIADVDATASAFCYSQPIWLQKMLLDPGAIPDTSGVSSATSSKVNVEAVLVSQLGPAATTIGEAIADAAAHDFLPTGLGSLTAMEGAAREPEKEGAEYFADLIISAFNDLIKEAFPNFSVAGPKPYAVGYCANDLPQDVKFPPHLSKTDPSKPNFGYNDFFLFGIAQGTAQTYVTGNQNNFLFSNDFKCGLFPGGAAFLCLPPLTVGPPTGVTLQTVEAGANNCTGTTMFADFQNPNVVGQPLGETAVNASAQSSPESASVNAYQSLPNEWDFSLVANVVPVSNSPACYDSDFGDAEVSSLAQISLMITYSGPVSISISAGDCPAYSVTPMVALTSSTGSNLFTLNGSGVPQPWGLTGTGVAILTANAGMATRVSNPQEAEVCEIKGSIEFISPTVPSAK